MHQTELNAPHFTHPLTADGSDLTTAARYADDTDLITRWPYHFGVTPKFSNRNASASAVCSNCLVVLLAPCPDLVSIRISIGLSPACAACSAAAYLNECAGTTRSS